MILSPPDAYPDFDIEGSRVEELPEKISPIPNDFRVFLFQTDLDDIRENWNHNFMAFTAVSPERREVVWYAESW